MITRLEACRYRCLKEVRQTLLPCQVLVGPNGSGKSAFLDVIGFLGDVVSGGLREAIASRTDNFYDLVWGRSDRSFSLALEARQNAASEIVRYEAEFRIVADDSRVEIAQERVMVPRDGWIPLKFAPDAGYSGLTLPFAQLAAGRENSQWLTWLRDLLRGKVQTVVLDNELLRGSTPPGRGNESVYNGFHLAPRAGQLRESSPDSFRAWLDHVQTAIPDLADIRMIVRPEDRHRYLMLRYAGGVEVPHWMVSDGTLRLLALTILGYIPDFNGIYLVEEAEIGLHPTAIETVWQSLSSVYGGQVLITSHSPLLPGLAKPEQLLCFQRQEDGTAIISGADHPLLKDWQSGVNLSDLFAAGVLG